jgi:hypothetical protein
MVYHGKNVVGKSVHFMASRKQREREIGQAQVLISFHGHTLNDLTFFYNALPLKVSTSSQ